MSVRCRRSSPPVTGREVSRDRVDRPRNVIHVATDASTVEKDFAEARRLFEVEGWSLREIGAAVGCSHETIRSRVMAEGWERDDAAVMARDEKRRGFVQAAVAANASKWITRRAAEADEAGATAKLARERAVLALVEGDPQMARAAAGVYLVMVDKAQLLSGGATSRDESVDLLDSQIVTLVEELRAAS